jgi:hypothetical protein
VLSPKPSPLFWFTTSELIAKPTPDGKRTLPLYLLATGDDFQTHLGRPGAGQVPQLGRLI